MTLRMGLPLSVFGPFGARLPLRCREEVELALVLRHRLEIDQHENTPTAPAALC